MLPPPAALGAPRQLLKVRTAQAVLLALLANLPRLGLLRETFELLRAARAMEQAQAPGGRSVRREDAVRWLEVALHAVVENYEEYMDYSATTTQSDYGENLHVLLEFLRLKAVYERFAWQMRPLATAHEVLARRGRDSAAVR